MKPPPERKQRIASYKASTLGHKALKHSVSGFLSLCMLAGLTCAQETTVENEQVRKPTGTTLTATSKPITIPSYSVELVAADGRKITANVLGFPTGGVQIQTADQKQHLLKWEKLSWETIAKLTGQELAYNKTGMDAQWLPSGPPKCSRGK